MREENAIVLMADFRKRFDRQRVFQLREQRNSYRQIARQLGIGEGTVRRVLAYRRVEPIA